MRLNRAPRIPRKSRTPPNSPHNHDNRDNRGKALTSHNTNPLATKPQPLIHGTHHVPLRGCIASGPSLGLFTVSTPVGKTQSQDVPHRPNLKSCQAAPDARHERGPAPPFPRRWCGALLRLGDFLAPRFGTISHDFRRNIPPHRATSRNIRKREYPQPRQHFRCQTRGAKKLPHQDSNLARKPYLTCSDGVPEPLPTISPRFPKPSSSVRATSSNPSSNNSAYVFRVSAGLA